MGNIIQLSVVIITFNEEKNIKRCIDSVQKVADEIMVVDSFSTDLTKSICLNQGIRFIENQFEDYTHQKNFGISQATYNYILSIDADEYLSEALCKSILKIKSN
jgi:glycosyltransferase involved in cell wall biosynthesis